MEKSTISIKEIMTALDICESTARRLIKSEGFPSIPVTKTKIVVSREAFLNWLNDPDKIVAYKDRQSRDKGAASCS